MGPEAPGAFDSALVVTVGQGVAAGGDALARLPDGRVLLVEGALPGETVVVRIVASRRDHARGRALGVVEPAASRIEPECRHARAEGATGGCGGCGWAHVAADAQIDLARRVVLDALVRIAHIDGPPPLTATPHSPSAGYRTTVTLAPTSAGRLAYHRRHGGGLVAVGDCRVAHPLVCDLIGRVVAPGWGSVTLRVGVAGGQRLVVLDPAARSLPRRRRASAPKWAGGPRRGRVDAPSDVVVVPPGGVGSVEEEVGARRWRISARSFFQPGPQGAGLLVDAVDAAVGEGIGPGDHVVDAYAGVGLLGGVVAERRGARLTSIESNPSAAADARHNLSDLDATVVAGEVGRWTPVRAQVVIADPARSGLGRPGVAALVATAAPRLVLVSCDPASLGRDTALLAQAGYGLAAVEIVAMFPDTVHFDTVSRFERAGCSEGEPGGQADRRG